MVHFFPAGCRQNVQTNKIFSKVFFTFFFLVLNLSISVKLAHLDIKDHIGFNSACQSKTKSEKNTFSSVNFFFLVFPPAVKKSGMLIQNEKK